MSEAIHFRNVPSPSNARLVVLDLRSKKPGAIAWRKHDAEQPVVALAEQILGDVLAAGQPFWTFGANK